MKNAKLKIRRLNTDYSYDPTPETIPISFEEKKVEIQNYEREPAARDTGFITFLVAIEVNIVL